MLKLIFEEKQNEENEKIISEGLAKNTLEKTGISSQEICVPYQFIYKDQNDQVQGGITGFCYYGCIYINMLWVSLEYQGQKLGTLLLDEAEKFGKQEGCIFSTVNTMEWEAPEFYKKLGYEVEFIRKGYTDDHKMFFLRKTL